MRAQIIFEQLTMHMLNYSNKHTCVTQGYQKQSTVI